MLYNLIITPIETIVNWVFLFILNKIPRIGVIGAVFGVSIVINFLALPLYNIADSLQERERKIAKSLEYRVGRIKKAFKGDERFMMLSTYYRINNYHPLYTLRSALSILIEIPFFIAAYHFLSHNEMLVGSSWWIFTDLGAPDTFFSICGLPIHILPILMTLINFVSGAIYTKEAPMREKIQLYGVAVVFLVLLYNSPSGLVIYWILNNIFSLIKNLVMKMKHPGKILHAIISGMMICMTVYFFAGHYSIKKTLVLFFITVVVTTLPIIKLYVSKLPICGKISMTENFPILLLSGIGIALLCGYLLPTNIIASSPTEFAYLGKTASPTAYIWSSFWTFAGFFVFWPVVIYKMFGKNVKKTMTLLFFPLFICALLNAFVFKANYGTLNVFLTLETKRVLGEYNLAFAILPVVIFCALFALLIFRKSHKTISFALITICIAQIAFGTLKYSYIKREYANCSDNRSSAIEIEKEIHLSKTKKNVIVLFMDRAIGSYLPLFFEQFPEYKKSFDGFTNYKNTVSFGSNTIAGAPALMGGYEYTPDAMKKRDTDLLVTKHNEATLLMPRLFYDKGYNVTVFDSPFLNYDSNLKFSPSFDDYPGMAYKKIQGKYKNLLAKDSSNSLEIDSFCKKGFINFGVLQIIMPPLRSLFYNYFFTRKNDESDYLKRYSSLYYINEETDFDSDTDNYIFIDNETCHVPSHLDENFVFPASANPKNLGNYKPFDDFEACLYESFCAAFLKLAKYFDFLRENDCYNNTRIIVVSDHGYHVQMGIYSDIKKTDIPEAMYDFTKKDPIPSSFDCILMCKDFEDNDPIRTNSDFMTQADTVYLATKNLGLSELNPFTGQILKSEKEEGANVYFQTSKEINVNAMVNRSSLFMDKKTAWHVVPGEKNNMKNWIPLMEWEKQQTENNTNGGSK